MTFEEFAINRARVQKILEQNKDKDFVQRILNPGVSPRIPEGDGWKTHYMAWDGPAPETWPAPDGSTSYVFPTVMRDGPTLKDYGNTAWDEARRRGEYIQFSNPYDADWFSKNYKSVWDNGVWR